MRERVMQELDQVRRKNERTRPRSDAPVERSSVRPSTPQRHAPGLSGQDGRTSTGGAFAALTFWRYRLMYCRWYWRLAGPFNGIEVSPFYARESTSTLQPFLQGLS